jgi:IS5 family transposase
MQASFSELEYAAKQKQTRRDRFLAQIETITPWEALEQIIAPHFPSRGGRGRPAIGLARMMRMYVAQQCFGLSDERIEDALYDSQAIRRFVGIDLGREAAPDAATLLKFCHLLEAHELTTAIFSAINAIWPNTGCSCAPAPSTASRWPTPSHAICWSSIAATHYLRRTTSS